MEKMLTPNEYVLTVPESKGGISENFKLNAVPVPIHDFSGFNKTLKRKRKREAKQKRKEEYLLDLQLEKARREVENTAIIEVEKKNSFDERACLNIIGTFLEIVLKSDDAKKNFTSQNDLIGYITDTLKYDFYGLSERNLKGVFAEANKSIREEKTK